MPTWTDNVTSGTQIKSVHINELRNNIDNLCSFNYPMSVRINFVDINSLVITNYIGKFVTLVDSNDNLVQTVFTNDISILTSDLTDDNTIYNVFIKLENNDIVKYINKDDIATNSNGILSSITDGKKIYLGSIFKSDNKFYLQPDIYCFANFYNRIPTYPHNTSTNSDIVSADSEVWEFLDNGAKKVTFVHLPWYGNIISFFNATMYNTSILTGSFTTIGLALAHYSGNVVPVPASNPDSIDSYVNAYNYSSLNRSSDTYVNIGVNAICGTSSSKPEIKSIYPVVRKSVNNYHVLISYLNCATYY